MHVNSLDKSYRSDLHEREKKRKPYPVDHLLQEYLATQPIQKTDFSTSRLVLADKSSAVDVIRSATNLYNGKACRLARKFEAHIDLSADCSDVDGQISLKSCTSSKTSSRTSIGTNQAVYDTFDSSVEGYLNLIANTLTVIIERGTNKMLCEAVEAVIAHLSFVDTVKLSLLKPLLTTCSTNDRVHLHASRDGTMASFRCLLGHDVPSIGLFSNISTVLALENVITAPCLRTIFYCYWSCLRSNLRQFKRELAQCDVLHPERCAQYVEMLRIALAKVEVQEADLRLDAFTAVDGCPDFAIDSLESDSILSESTDCSYESVSEAETDGTSIASDPQIGNSLETSFRYLSDNTNFPPPLSSKYGQEKKGRWNSLMKPLRQFMQTRHELALF